MAIITIPGSITKGTTFSITINRTDISNISIVNADDYFSDTDNWNYVILNYTSGNQSKSVKCQASSGSFLSSTLPSSGFVYNSQHLSSIYFSGGTVNNYGSYTSLGSTPTYSQGQQLTFEIKRVGSTITFKVGATTIHTLNNSNSLYIIGALYPGNTFVSDISIASISLT